MSIWYQQGGGHPPAPTKYIYADTDYTDYRSIPKSRIYQFDTLQGTRLYQADNITSSYLAKSEGEHGINKQ